MKNYKDYSYWTKYQPFFPEHSRVHDESMIAEEWFQWKDCAIHIDRYKQPSAPITIIVIHGAGGYGRLFAPIANILYQAGYEVIAPDLPGYGLSDAKNQHISYQAWVNCLCDLVEHEYSVNKRNIVLCGGSLGGYLAYLCAAQLGKNSPVSGVIATTLADPRLDITKKQFARNQLIQSVGMPTLPLLAKTIGGMRLPIKWFTKMHAMSNDPKLSDIVAKDSLGGGNTVPISFMQSLFTISPAVEPEDFDFCPVLLVHPDSDKWTGLASSQLFFDRIKGSKTLQLLENCGHFPIENPGINQLEASAKKFLKQIQAALNQ